MYWRKQVLLQKYFVVRQKLVSEALSEYFVTTEKNEQYLNEAIRYSLLAEGKRLRPILLFAVYEMLRGRKSIKSLERIMPVAVALEMVHTASLVHERNDVRLCEMVPFGRVYRVGHFSSYCCIYGALDAVHLHKERIKENRSREEAQNIFGLYTGVL